MSTVRPPASAWSTRNCRRLRRDYDLLLRATRTGDILSVPEPLDSGALGSSLPLLGQVAVHGGRLTYILRKFPRVRAGSQTGLPRIAGQVAYAQASLATIRRRAYARAALRRDPKQRPCLGRLRGLHRHHVSPLLFLTSVQKTGRGLNPDTAQTWLLPSVPSYPVPRHSR